jgi:hypothetical protein
MGYVRLGACRDHDSVFVSIALAKDDTALVFRRGRRVRWSVQVYHGKLCRPFPDTRILISLTSVGLGRGVWWAMRPSICFSNDSNSSCQVGSVSSIHLCQSRVSQGSESVWLQWVKQPSRRSSSPITSSLHLTKYAATIFYHHMCSFFDKWLPARERSCQIQVPQWGSVQRRTPHGADANNVRWPRRTIPFTKPRGLLHGRVGTQGARLYARVWAAGVKRQPRSSSLVLPSKPKDYSSPRYATRIQSSSWNPRFSTAPRSSRSRSTITSFRWAAQRSWCRVQT